MSSGAFRGVNRVFGTLAGDTSLPIEFSRQHLLDTV